MQQLDTLRKRFDARSQWFQVGLASATLLTPLLKRWNDLRAIERARTLRDEAGTRLRDMRSRIPTRQDEARREARQASERVTTPRGTVSARIWLVGVGVGLVLAGAGAYFLVRRRMSRALEEPMVELPIAPSVNGAYARETAQAVAAEISRRDQPAASTAAMSDFSTTGAQEVPFSQGRPLMPQPPMPEAAPETISPEAPVGEPDETSGEEAMLIEGSALAGMDDAGKAAFIGNIRTMVYHTADADNLPTEENRIYFASEEEAHQMGYRRDRDEVSSGGE